jgi:putative acetyltransferase
MLLRRERPADARVVHDLHRAAFTRDATADRPAGDGRAEADLVDALRADGDLVPACCLVAEAPSAGGAGGAVVGHVAVSRATVGGEAGVLALGPLGVLPAHQGTGVGSALVHATLAAADALGARGMVLLGHADYYPRFGFEPAVHHGVTPPQDWGPQFFLLRRLEGWGAGMAGPFRYAPAFDRLES